MIAFTYIHALLSTTEFKIDADNNLTISKISATNTASKTKVSLQGLSSTPRIRADLNKVQIMLALLFTVIGSVLTWFGTESFVAAAIYIFISASLSSFLVTRNMPKTYSYIDSRSGKEIFSISDLSPNNSAFIETLNNTIKDMNLCRLNISNNNDNMHNYNQQLKHLDALFNIGIINQTLYQTIHQRIEAVIYGKKDESREDNVIPLPVSTKSIA